ncbi:hypothetical protein HK096_000850, partial [Nowakowskiella sp. JEL0078]
MFHKGMRNFIILVLSTLVYAQIDYSTHVSRVNQLRSAAGLGYLTIDSRLNTCAQSHAQDMNDNVGLSHSGSDGSTPGQRIQKCVGSSNIYAGENAGAGYDNDISVIVAWFNSPEHKANLLGANYNSIGIGRVGTYWVENFSSTSGNGGSGSSAVTSTRAVAQSPSPSPKVVQQSSSVLYTSSSTIKAIVSTTIRVTTATTTGSVASATATFVNPFKDIVVVPENGTLVNNIPGIDSIVPTTFNTNVTDSSGSNSNDIDDRLYAGTESEKEAALAKVALLQLSAEEQADYLNARELYGDTFNPFLLLTSG